MSKDDIDNVVDPTVREILRKYFADGGKFSAQNPPLHRDGKTPILSVRMKENASNMYDYRGEGNTFFMYGSNHHVEILEHKTEKNKDGTPKKAGAFITMWEANRRAKSGEKIVNRIGPWTRTKNGEIFPNTDWIFAYSLQKNDMFQHPDGKIYTIISMSGPKEYIRLCEHRNTVPKKTVSYDLEFSSPNTISGQKIQIDPLGNISPSND